MCLKSREKMVGKCMQVDAMNLRLLMWTSSFQANFRSEHMISFIQRIGWTFSKASCTSVRSGLLYRLYCWPAPTTSVHFHLDIWLHRLYSATLAPISTWNRFDRFWAGGSCWFVSIFSWLPRNRCWICGCWLEKHFWLVKWWHRYIDFWVM